MNRFLTKAITICRKLSQRQSMYEEITELLDDLDKQGKNWCAENN